MQRNRNSSFKFLKFLFILFALFAIIDSIVHSVNAIQKLNDDKNDNIYRITIMCVRIVMSAIAIPMIYKESHINSIVSIVLVSLYGIFMTVFMFVSPTVMDYSLISLSLIVQIIATYLSLMITFKLFAKKFCDANQSEENSNSSSRDLTYCQNNNQINPQLTFGKGKKFGKILSIIDKNFVAFGTLLTVIIAIALGSLLKETSPQWSARTLKYMGFIGEIFLRILKALVLPLIFSSIVFAMSNIETKLLGKIGFRVFLYYSTTTILATILSIVLVLTITPGSRTQINDGTIAGSESIQSTNEDNAMDIIRFVNNKFYSIKGIGKE